jgi:hypothetical protein
MIPSRAGTVGNERMMPATLVRAAEESGNVGRSAQDSPGNRGVFLRILRMRLSVLRAGLPANPLVKITRMYVTASVNEGSLVGLPGI